MLVILVFVGVGFRNMLILLYLLVVVSGLLKFVLGFVLNNFGVMVLVMGLMLFLMLFRLVVLEMRYGEILFVLVKFWFVVFSCFFFLIDVDIVMLKWFLVRLLKLVIIEVFWLLFFLEWVGWLLVIERLMFWNFLDRMKFIMLVMVLEL